MWIAFWCGTVVGGAAALFVAAVCMAAGDEDRSVEACVQGVSADDAQAMLDWAGDTPSNLWDDNPSRPRPGSACVVPELNIGVNKEPTK